VLSDVFIIGLRSIGGFVIESQVPVVPMIYSFFLAYLVALLAAWYPAVRASQVKYYLRPLKMSRCALLIACLNSSENRPRIAWINAD
jgi:hypothetical protein